MYSKFWDNVREKLEGKKERQKWLAQESGVGRTAINNGIAKLNKPEPEGREIKNSPSVDNSYAIARTLAVTIEELVDGEAGAEYVREWARQDGKVYQPPERIADIVDLLDELSDRDLEVIKMSAKTMLGLDKETKEKREVQPGEVM
jgi:phosphoglycolate phosphatase-like HAD superfamily hydrolase